MCVGARDTLCQFLGSPDAIGRKTSLARAFSKWFPNGLTTLGTVPFPKHSSLLKQVAFPKGMKQLNLSFSRTHRAAFVIRIVFLAALVAGLVFIVARGKIRNSAASPGRSAGPTLSSPEESSKAKIGERYGKLPLSFETNEGKTGGQVKFVSRGPG